MKNNSKNELKKRSFVKTIIWRVIGIVWTWIGAYFIVQLLPENMKNAATIATAVVIFHHSTRMIMYYFYERIWNNITWGKVSRNSA
ncbi:MAG: DUF2061 domain-containing protein [Victivallaceae bacterium]|nr:DUF2061 domain-containing protein [Victivallaceae bacterium]